MAVCGGCGKFGPEEARFCSACGSPLAAAPLFERSARKTVTVVFADIAGSTELGDRLDPETIRQVMSRYFRTTRRVLERHGGTVEKFIGDAVMAVFGIPVLHEDDALRATRAAVEMAGSLRRDDTRATRRSRHRRGDHAVPGEGEARCRACSPGPQPRIEHAIHHHGFPVRRP
jgi:class 3 adenylate cyclase